MTSSKIELPGEVKTDADAAALMASLQLMPSPVPNPEIKYTKVCGTTETETLSYIVCVSYFIHVRCSICISI